MAKSKEFVTVATRIGVVYHLSDTSTWRKGHAGPSLCGRAHNRVIFDLPWDEIPPWHQCTQCQKALKRIRGA